MRTTLPRAAGLAAILVLTIVGRAWALAGDLDGAYGGGDGIVTEQFDTGKTFGLGVAIQTDGRAVVAGYSWAGSQTNMAVARYTTGGVLDSAFGGGDGKVTIDFSIFGIPRDDVAWAVVIQPDGKIVVAGTSAGRFAVARLHAGGTLDLTFSGDGKVRTDLLGADDFGNDVVLQPDGKIVVGGRSGGDVAIVRYLSDGTADSSFSGDGEAYVPFGWFGNAVALSGTRILVAGSSNDGDDFFLARLTRGGVLDTRFGGGDGWVETDFSGGHDSAHDLAVQADGRIVLAGEASVAGDPDFALASYSAGGALDSTFSGDGKKTTDVLGDPDLCGAMAIQADGNYVVVGRAETPDAGPDDQLAVVRYKPGGGLDTSFGGDGKVTTDFPSTIVSGNDVAIQANGKIVVVGSSSSAWLVARYLAA